ncbi:MAG TPA: GDP-mannose 4,6-dehydratase [Acidobacteriota bacterium]|nr:GDP-mannose 4,6-dehydratase [Acidobacteriota bacterium]
MPSQSTGKHYLITGGAGFIGSHLCEALLERGDQVTIIDNLSTGRFENIEHLVEQHGKGPQSRFRFAIDTIRNETVLDRLASQCDTVIHLAAAVGVRLIVEQPVHTIETNIMGTESVLKVAQRYRCKVLLASTSEVYGKGNKVPFREDDDVVLGPTTRSRWAYAASKMVDEFLTLAYHRQKGLPVVILRFFNTVGPRQTGRYGMVIPRFIGQALEGKPLTVYGDGTQSRCFLHVKDAISAVLSLEDYPKGVGRIYNVGSTEEISIEQLARQVLVAVKAARGTTSSEIVHIPYEKAFQAGFEDLRRRKPDVGKLEQATGWKAKYGLEAILAETVRSLYTGPDQRSDPPQADEAT